MTNLSKFFGKYCLRIANSTPRFVSTWSLALIFCPATKPAVHLQSKKFKGKFAVQPGNCHESNVGQESNGNFGNLNFTAGAAAAAAVESESLAAIGTVFQRLITYQRVMDSSWLKPLQTRSWSALDRHGGPQADG